MEKKFYFVLILVLSFFFALFSSSVLADTTTYGVSMFEAILSYQFVFLGVITLVVSWGIVHWSKNKFHKQQFVYENDYKKFKPRDKVKITFINKDKEEVTVRCRIVSIDNEKISFEVGKKAHECIASMVKNIKKSRRNLIVLSIITVFLLLMALFYSFKSKIFSTNYRNYEVEKMMSDYGFSSSLEDL